MLHDALSYPASQPLVAVRFVVQASIHCILFLTLKVLFKGPCYYAPTFNCLLSSVGGGRCALDLLTEAHFIAGVDLRLLTVIDASCCVHLGALNGGFQLRPYT